MESSEKIQLKDDINEPWDPKKFNIERKPWTVGVIKSKGCLERLPSCIDMPIKLKGSEDIVLPFPYSLNPAVNEIIAKVIEAEKEVNPNYKDYYAYITVDCADVKAGNTHRRAGWHIDGMQGVRYSEKLPVCHSFLYSTAYPTEFAINPFKASHLDEVKHNWFDEFSKQVDYNSIYTPDRDALVAMSAYNIHRSALIKEDLRRAFVRIEFSKKKFNRIGNSINPLLPTDFVYEERKIPFPVKEIKTGGKCRTEEFNPDNKIANIKKDSWCGYIQSISTHRGAIYKM